PYFTFAGWQNRAFAVPPAMGVDYRVVNGYVYISPNPVTDPDLIAERAEFFQKRAGYYFENWDELYVKWREAMESLNREVEAIKDPWFNMGTGDGLYHYYGSWNDDPRIPYQSLTGHISALQEGKEIDRPTEEVIAERDRIAAEYAGLLDEQARPTFEELL